MQQLVCEDAGSDEVVVILPVLVQIGISGEESCESVFGLYVLEVGGMPVVVRQCWRQNILGRVCDGLDDGIAVFVVCAGQRCEEDGQEDDDCDKRNPEGLCVAKCRSAAKLGKRRRRRKKMFLGHDGCDGYAERAASSR
jgi:hypothetical protein